MARRSEIVILSNRLPVHRVRHGGSTRWETSPGGLVSALTPVLRGHDSTWIGWAGTSGKPPAPFEHNGIRNEPIRLTKDELAGYYDGFSNATLWPLYHDAIRPPEYRRRWWHPYEEVNRRFAEAAANAVAKNGIVWVHDYHLQLVPAMIRERRPDVKIGFFLHIPFPPQELFAQIPWRVPLLEGILGSDVVGFQTSQGAQNFAQLCKRFVGTPGRQGDLQVGDRACRVRSFPISIDTERFESLAASEEVEDRVAELRKEIGPDRRVILGVDRLDYTKGIDIRLRAFQDLLRSEAWDPSSCVFVQVCVPSRERVEQYRDLKTRIESLIGQINGEFGEVGLTAVHYLHRSLPVEELVALYRVADVMAVTPFRDGMNLVAKEYVASRLDETGVLLLSEFAGTAKELRSAMLVNPHDIDGLVHALDDALSMPRGEQRQRIRSMRRIVRQHDIFLWSRQFMEELRR